MCNVEEKCKKMRNAALKLLTEELKEAQKEEKVRECRKIMSQLDEEISTYECLAFQRVKARIKAYQEAKSYPGRMRIIGLLIAEMEAFLSE